MNFSNISLLFLFLLFLSNNLKTQELTEVNLEYLQSLPPEIQAQFQQSQKQPETSQAQIILQDNYVDDTSLKERDIENQKFGFNFFENSPSKISETYNDVPLMSNYVLSVNDELDLIVTGSKKATYKLRVNLGGSIQIPEIGQVNVNGLALDEANSKINQLISEYYVGAKSDLSVRKTALKKISVIGAVNKPGTYIVNPYTTVSQAINYAEGLDDNASLRTIEVIDYKGSKKLSDLYQFLVFGMRNSDLSLKNGDTVFVKPTSSFVKIYGEVHRPMNYEYLADDKYEDLLLFAQGGTKDADLNNVAINSAQNNLITTKKITLEQTVGQQTLESLNVSRKIYIQNRNVEIVGDVVKSGFIVDENFSKLDELLDSLEFSQEIYPFFFTLDQSSNNGLTTEKYNLSLADPSSYADITLNNNVKIEFFSRAFIDDFNTQFEMNENESEFEESEDDLKIDEKIFENFLNSALIVKISNKNILLPNAGKYYPISILNFLGTNLELDLSGTSVTNAFGSYFENVATKQFPHTDGTTVIFPEQNLSQSVKVSIEGEVLYPGEYEVNKNTSVDDLYKIAGGFTSRADQRAIVFSRKSIREKERDAFNSAKKLLIDISIGNFANPSQVVSGSQASALDESFLVLFESISEDSFKGRLSGNLKEGSLTSITTILEEGDLLIVPPKINTISVIGEVLSPASLSINGNYVFEDYISESGGYTRFADKRNIYIIKSDGTSISADQGLFQNRYVLQPGDTIVVPRNLEKISTIPLVSIATKIISDLAFAAASINALNN